MSEESFKTLVTLDSSSAPKLPFIYNKVMGPKFKGIYLIKDNTLFTHRNVEYFLIVDKLDVLSRDLNINLTLDDWLFGTLELTKNADPDKYEHSGYSIGFNVCSQLSL